MAENTDDTIRNMVLEIVGDHLGIPPVTLNVTDQIIDDLGADSLDKMELIMSVEELFEIKISDKNVAKINTIADIINEITLISPSPADLRALQKTWRLISKSNM